MKKLLFFAAGFLFFTFSSAQESSDFSASNSFPNLSDSLEQIYGTNDLLVNGRVYLPKHSSAEGYPYFPENEWISSTLYIKGEVFENIDLKYDTELDKVILKEKLRTGQKVQIVLNDGFVDSFFLAGHHFINSACLMVNEIPGGYFEQVYKGGFTFLIKHHKEFNPVFSRDEPFGKYTTLHSVFHVYADGKLTKLPTKKVFYEYFKARQGELKRFMEDNRMKYKKLDREELYKLLEFCDRT